MASAEESATWRIRFADSTETILSDPVATFTTQQTSSAAKAYPADRDALALPRMPMSNMATAEGGRVVVEVLGDAADVVESEESDGQIPLMLIHKKSGKRKMQNIRVGDTGEANLAGFNSTHDVTLNTSNYVRLGAYSVPDGWIATLGAGQPVHLYLGDDTA